MKEEFSISQSEKLLGLIDRFIKNAEGFSPTELLESGLNIPRSTLFNLLKELKDLGYLEQTETRGRYFIGPKIKAWIGVTGPNYQSLLSVFEKETNGHQYDETIAIAAPGSSGIVLLQQVESIKPIRAVYQVGEPLHADHPAYALLQPHPKLSIIRQGYGLGEREDRFELAVPICANGIQADAVLTVNAPTFRWEVETLVETWLPLLRTMAARLSYRLGASAYTPYQSVEEKYNQPTEPLTAEQIQNFLSGPWAARLACIRPDGSPHVIPVWQEWDGESFYILAWQGSQWAEFVLQNPNVSLSIDEPWQPLRRITARGEMQQHQPSTPQEQHDLLNRLTQRYLGQAASEEFFTQTATIFRLNPNFIRGWKGLPTAKSND